MDIMIIKIDQTKLDIQSYKKSTYTEFTIKYISNNLHTQLTTSLMYKYWISEDTLGQGQ